jgi:hypothetical protein
MLAHRELGALSWCRFLQVGWNWDRFGFHCASILTLVYCEARRLFKLQVRTLRPGPWKRQLAVNPDGAPDPHVVLAARQQVSTQVGYDYVRQAAVSRSGCGHRGRDHGIARADFSVIYTDPIQHEEQAIAAGPAG